MPKIIFLDTETTGNTENDYLCQIAYRTYPDANFTSVEEFCALYKPPAKIPPEASAVHHITNEMVDDKPLFKSSQDSSKIKQLLEDDNAVLVAHNAPFDIMIMQKEDIAPKKFICTLRVARHLDPEGQIPRYNLQYLRYLLNLRIDATAHDALGDVLVVEKLFDKLKAKMMEVENIDQEKAIEKMMEISSRPSLLHTFPFGKHTGKKIKEVLEIDRGYLEWLLGEKLKSGQPDEDWIYTLKYHLGKE